MAKLSGNRRSLASCFRWRTWYCGILDTAMSSVFVGRTTSRTTGHHTLSPVCSRFCGTLGFLYVSLLTKIALLVAKFIATPGLPGLFASRNNVIRPIHGTMNVDHGRSVQQLPSQVAPSGSCRVLSKPKLVKVKEGMPVGKKKVNQIVMYAIASGTNNDSVAAHYMIRTGFRRVS